MPSLPDRSRRAGPGVASSRRPRSSSSAPAARSRSCGRPSSASAAGPASPAATSPALALAAGSTAAAPSPSPSPSAAPGKRRTFRTRPDLTPPEIEIATPARGRVAPGYILYTPGNGAGSTGRRSSTTQASSSGRGPGSGRSVADFRVVAVRGPAGPHLVGGHGQRRHRLGRLRPPRRDVPGDRPDRSRRRDLRRPA